MEVRGRMERDVLHIRLPSFFSAVEQLRHPDLGCKALIVAMPKANTSGIVLSASEAALKLGVLEGISVRQAQRLCPGAVFVKADWAAYKQAFSSVMDILYRYSPLLEPDSIGSAYMDITEPVSGRGRPETTRLHVRGFRSIVGSISNEVSRCAGLPIHIGHAPNKLVARIASGTGAKYFRVKSADKARFLAPMPIKVLDSVSASVLKRLDQLGITTLGRLSAIPERCLIKQFGPTASLIKRQSVGIDFAPVLAAYPPEVINIEHTFACCATEPSAIEPHLHDIASQASMILMRRGALAGEVTLELMDESKTLQGAAVVRCSKMKNPTDSAYTIFRTLLKALMAIMASEMEVSKVRVTFSELAQGQGSQLSLIGDCRRREQIDRTIQLIRNRFGDDSVLMASAFMYPNRAAVLERISVR